jgi:hypothetical protein
MKESTAMNTDGEELLHDDHMAMPPDESQRESGMPGGGRGRRDDIGTSGVYPVSNMEGASDDALLVGEMEWGQGERGAEGYYDAGSSEITFEVGTAITGERGVSGNVAEMPAGAGTSTSMGTESATDPSDAATDPHSGHA